METMAPEDQSFKKHGDERQRGFEHGCDAGRHEESNHSLSADERHGPLDEERIEVDVAARKQRQHGADDGRDIACAVVGIWRGGLYG